MRNDRRKATTAIITAAALSAAMTTLDGRKEEEEKKTSTRIKRERRTVEQIYQSLGVTYFRCAFRMDYDKFQLLHHKIDAEINDVMSRFYIRKGGRKGGNYIPPPVQNGAISNMTRIACALQYFCGASAYDLMANFDISHPEVMKSVWFVVDAINQVDEFRIQIVALVTALAKLHNYCIQSRTDSIDDDTLIYLKSDEDKIFTNENGYVAVNKSKNNYSCPDLIGGGEHFQDIPNRSFWRPKTSSILPRTILHQMVIDSHKTRQ